MMKPLSEGGKKTIIVELLKEDAEDRFKSAENYLKNRLRMNICFMKIWRKQIHFSKFPILKSKEDIMGAEHDRIMGIANSFPM